MVHRPNRTRTLIRASTHKNPVVWTEVPVSDLAASMVFYGDVIGTPLTLDKNGPNLIFVFSGGEMTSVAGHLYLGKLAANGQGPTLHLAIGGTLEDAMVRCTKAGGQVQGPIVTIPPGRFTDVRAPDGNSAGLFESA